MRIKKPVLIVLFVSFFIVAYVNSQETAGETNFVNDEAGILNNDQELNVFITELYNYKDLKTRIIIYTIDDESVALEKVKNGFTENNLEDSSLNVLIVYNKNWKLPFLVFPKRCSLDKEDLNYFLKEDPLGVSNDFVDGNYDEGMSTLVVYLINEIEFRIDFESQVCRFDDLNKNTELIELVKDDLLKGYKLKEIPDEDLKRINKYDKYFKKAHEMYPSVPINLIKAIVTTESHGVADTVNSIGAAGLMQIMPCTGTDLKLVESVRCQKCKDGLKKCLACSKNCEKEIPVGYDLRKNPEQNIIKGTKYINRLLNKCAGPQFFLSYLKERTKKALIAEIKLFDVVITKNMNPKKIMDIIKQDLIPRKDFRTGAVKCALASYNYGPGNLAEAVLNTDSITYDKYGKKLPGETKNYVLTVLGYYKWLEENYPST